MCRSKSNWMRTMIGAGVGFVMMAAMINSKAVAAGPEKVTEIRIGAMESLTGVAAGPSGAIREAVDLAVDEINAAGGVKSLGGAKLKLFWADSGDSPDRAAAVTERLITEEKISVMMGGHIGSMVVTSSAVAEKYKIPYLVMSTGDEKVTGRGFKYVFQPMPSVPRSYTEPVFTFMEDVKKNRPKSEHVETMAAIINNIDIGRRTLNDFFLPYCEKYGYKCVLSELFPTNITDFNPLVIKVKSVNPDVIFFWGWGSDGMLFLRSVAAAKLAPKMIFMPASGNDPKFHETMKQYCHTVMVPAPFSVGTDPQALALGERFKKRYGKVMPNYGAGQYPTVFILHDAVERAASVDPEKIREAFSKTDLQGWPQSLLSWRRVKFDETGMNVYFGAAIFQLLWEQGRVNSSKIVWPNDLATAQPSYPGDWAWMK